jgi:hypothetical protein
MNRRVAKQRMQLQEQAMKVSRSGDGVTVRQMIDEKRRP